MIDLHTHTFMSDGVLSISELVYREKVAGYEAIAITDHTDFSNYKQVIDAVKSLKDSLSYEYGIKVLSGVELTYVPPKKIYDLTKRCRDYGADIVVVHGETSVETVPEKTNIEAIKAKVDILAHPGFISDEEVFLAKDNGVFLEITTRPGHRNTNKLVFEKAKKFGANLVCNNDAHYPENILTKEKILQVLSEFEIFEEDYYNMLNNSKLIIKDK